MELFDGHSHILPEVDDGSPNIEYSKKMFVACKKAGITHVICTPHFRDGLSDLGNVDEIFSETKKVAEEIGVNIALGYEFFYKQFSRISYEKTPGYTLGNSNLFLLEFSLHEYPHNWETMVYKVQAEGLKVIIAHPERFFWVHNDLEIVDRFKDAGCLIMSSANFLNKTYLDNRGKFKSVTKKLLKRKLIDIIASDAHRVDGYHSFIEGINFAKKYGYSIENSNNILREVFS